MDFQFSILIVAATTDGVIVGMSVRKFIFNKKADDLGLDYTVLYEAVEDFMHDGNKQTLLRQGTFYDGWAGLFIKGTSQHCPFISCNYL